MNPLNSFYWFQNAASKTLCDHIIRFAKEKEDEKKLGLTEAAGGGKVNRDKKFKNLTKKEKNLLLPSRKSEVIWLEEPWIFRNMEFWMDIANKEAKWNYKIDSVEMAQFTIYEKGYYYDWHVDSFKKPNKEGRIRKLSMTLSLSEGDEYKGGELEFATHGKTPHEVDTYCLKEIRSKGSLVVFPSYVWHRVKPVTKGIRKSLVVWFGGPKYK